MGEGAIEGDLRQTVRARQLAAVARLGQHALAGSNLRDLLNEGALSAAEETRTDYSKLLELLPDGHRLLLRAGVGWKDGYVGSAIVEAGTDSQAGFTLLSRQPVILPDARSEKRFSLASLHKAHRITSGVTVVVPGRDGPFGILGVYTREHRDFSQDDVWFLQSLANVLAAAIDRARADQDRERLLEEMRRLADTSRQQAGELQGVLDNMLDGVFVTDQHRRAILVNRAGARMLGLKGLPNPLDVQPLMRIRRSNGNSYGEDHPLLRALRGESVDIEVAVVNEENAGPDISVRLTAAPIRDEAGEVVAAVAVTRDITAMVELSRLKEQFISTAAHELKTPVAVMKGYAQALQRMGDSLPPSARKMLAAIDRGSDRIDRIVKDLLDISRFHMGPLALNPERVDLSLVAGHVAARAAAGTKKHDIAVHSVDGAVVLGDRGRIEQVIANLIDNAIKYSPDGGDVDLTVEIDGEEAVVTITDHGIGIPSDRQGGIFQQFYRAHAGTPHDYGGMGVGLYICREIVTWLGGRISFESTEGVGSCFQFALPLARRHDVDE